MPRIAVIGGIGAGKSAVTDYLAERGALIVDADVIAREVVAPGQPALAQLRDAFGDAILTPEGTLDREFVAAVAFHDRSALSRLNRITHTAIGLAIIAQLSAVAVDHLAVVAVPLFRPEHRAAFGLDEVWCVAVDPDIARSRLVEQRHMTAADADARLAAQPPLAQRVAEADLVLQNDGTLSDLRARVDAALAERGLLRA